MKTHIEHTNPENLFEKVEIPFSDSKEEVWDKLFERLSEESGLQAEKKMRSISWFKLAAAVVLILLGGITLFLKFYTTTIQTEKGEHISHFLPDGSAVQLNAVSSISYHPYWWRFERELLFEGEAFFEIEKGKDFLVTSENGETKVLGTSFNIFARNNDYNVYCETGTVKVSSTTTDVELIIKQGQQAILDNNNKLGKIENFKADQILDWKNNKFNFNAEPLNKVFAELERQYNVNINIELDDATGFLYTGYFTKSTSVEVTLDLICKSFDFTFVKLGNKNYSVLQKTK